MARLGFRQRGSRRFQEPVAKLCLSSMKEPLAVPQSKLFTLESYGILVSCVTCRVAV